MQNGEVNPDLWKHRSNGLACSTCMWYVEKEKIVGGDHQALGRCRRHAPTADYGYPSVFSNDWCGDHKLDENKI